MKLSNPIQMEVLLITVLLSFTGIHSAPQLESDRWENETETSREYAFQTLNKSSGSEDISDNSDNPRSSNLDHLRIGLKAPIISIRTVTKDRKRPSSLIDPQIDGIHFHENKPALSIRNAIASSKPSVFFTQSQKDQHLHYPNDIINPNNRLQITDEALAEITNAQEIMILPNSNESTDRNSSSPASTSAKEFAKIPLKSYHQDSVRTIDLTFDIVRASSWNEENIIFSPLSICNVLALLMLGSKGRTYNEIAEALKVKGTTRLSPIERSIRFHEEFNKLLILLHSQAGNNVSLEIANEIFSAKDFNIEGSYVAEAQKYYQTPVQSFDFGKDGQLFRDLVNEWVKIKTNGKILSIIDEPPSATTTLALINAVYFKGPWEIPFVERITRKREFYVKPNETIEVRMMTNVMTIPYLDREDYQMVGIPYRGNVTRFFVILPKSSSGIEAIKDLEKKLSAKMLTEDLAQMQMQKVAVKIPKMKITTDGHMNEILANLGITTIFNPMQANFSKISPNDGLYISSVHHRAIIEVNEKGTEAAAVTIGAGDRIIEELPIPFVANKPFIFFIYHQKAKALLFCGRVTRPQWN